MSGRHGNITAAINHSRYLMGVAHELERICRIIEKEKKKILLEIRHALIPFKLLRYNMPAIQSSVIIDMKPLDLSDIETRNIH